MIRHYRPQQDCAPQIHMQPSLAFPLAHNDWAGTKNMESLYCQLRTRPQQPPQSKQLTPTQKIHELQSPTHSPRHALTISSFTQTCSFSTAPSLLLGSVLNSLQQPDRVSAHQPHSHYVSSCFWLRLLLCASSPPQPACPATPCFPSVLSAPPTHTCSVSEMLSLTQTQLAQHPAPSWISPLQR